MKKIKKIKFNDLEGYVANIDISLKANEECQSMQRDIINYLAKENFKMANVVAIMEAQLKKFMSEEDYESFEEQLAGLVVELANDRESGEKECPTIYQI